jgi:hypothetical protein
MRSFNITANHDETKMDCLAAILSFALVLGYPPAPEDEVAEKTYVAQFPSYVFGKLYVSRIPGEVLEKAPDWQDDQENPPLSARKALKLAASMRDSVVKEPSAKLEMFGTTLLQIGKKWAWLVRFSPDGQMQGDIPPADQLTIIVLMDGTAIEPKKVAAGDAIMLGDPAGVIAQSQIIAKSQIIFAGPEGMVVAWEVAFGQFDREPLICPGRFNFPQGAIYRLKFANIPRREGVELYPTLEVGAALPRTEAYLAHNGIPVQFTDEDFDHVLSGRGVTKIIYLPDPEFQDRALDGVETLVSTRLDPSVDPIIEADKRGAILAIVRMGSDADAYDLRRRGRAEDE